jgi:hypothetical protein
MLLMPSCVSGPTLEEYNAAQIVLEDPAATEEQRAAATEIVEAFNEGWDWQTPAYTILSILLGMPIVSPRARQIAGAAITFTKSLDGKNLAKAGAAYVGARHSSDILEKANAKRSVAAVADDT